MDQNRTPLYDAILDFINKDYAPFMVPGHKMGKGINPKWKDYVSENIFKMDLCEVEGLDDMQNPSGVIKESLKLAADAFGADRTFSLVNGTSVGIIAAIMTVANNGDKIIVPRNAHRSVASALIISGAKPVWAMPELEKNLGLVGGMLPETIKELYKTENISALFAVSPSYHGICTDLKKLIDIAHKNNNPIIADEAHGNHTHFYDALPKDALSLGADITCQSIHKMVGSLTQSSYLHMQGDRIDIGRLKSNISMLHTTSPSYLLQVSLELARSYIAVKGRKILAELLENLNEARTKLKALPGIDVLDKSIIGKAAIFDYEPIRLVISTKDLGIRGYEVFEILKKEYRVEPEFGDYFYTIAVAGIGTTKEDIDKLVAAFTDISKRFYGKNKPLEWNEKMPALPPIKLSPREAWFAKTERIPWQKAKGRISSELIVPYPPGIPAVCPGEEITDEIFEFIENHRLNGKQLHGTKDETLETLLVVK
ncbi:MAG: aminotransferase class I/II-fold pyridoxal phosphate-dependent enzyme [Clostridiales Family XIII bacterium]|nr:aminotransferase class I/II-fold pyridoxal phosphate-dependent enzyme [Clostridiales Family XIII bacterium]